MLGSSTPTGNINIEERAYSPTVFINGVAIVFDDSNDPPPISANTPVNAIHLKLRSDGSWVKYNAVSLAWEPASITTIDKFSSLVDNLPDGFYNIMNDDSSGGDGLPSLYWKHKDVDNNILKTYIVGVDK